MAEQPEPPSGNLSGAMTTPANDARHLPSRAEAYGHVVLGDQAGGEWGFPTANVAVDAGTRLPGSGIYAGWCFVPNVQPCPAALYVGDRRVRYKKQVLPIVEAHLLDYSGSLYGQRVRLVFDKLVRASRRFESTEELVRQIGKDVGRIRQLLLHATQARELDERRGC